MGKEDKQAVDSNSLLDILERLGKEGDVTEEIKALVKKKTKENRPAADALIAQMSELRDYLKKYNK